MNDFNELVSFSYFPTNIYMLDRPEFLGSVSEVFDEYVQKAKNSFMEKNELYEATMSENIFQDERIASFSNEIKRTAWNILNEQGYAMDLFSMEYTQMFAQEHPKNSSMEQHIHGWGEQIVGFYFLNAPENSSRVLIHDSRPAKVITNLPERNPELATPASNIINFQAKEGRFIFTNAYLTHSFTRHGNDKPLKFIHFNLTVLAKPNGTGICVTDAEVI